VTFESKLSQAARHVAEGKRIVARQRALVARQKEAGVDTLYAETLLAQFQRTLGVFEEHFLAIQKENFSERLTP
jgi:hypothetical protein